MIESLVDALNERRQNSPQITGQITGNEAIATDTEESAMASEAPITLEEARKLLTILSTDSPALTGEEFSVEMEEQDIFEMILPALERLVRQVERTFEHYTVTLGRDKIDKMYVSSPLNFFSPLLPYVGEQLGIDKDILDPMGQKISLSEGDMAELQSPTLSERLAFVPALGLALSDNAHTPNFIFTYKEKEKEARISLINRVIFVFFMGAVFICSLLFLYQGHMTQQKRGKLAKLERELIQDRPHVDQKMIRDLADKVKQQQEMTKAAGKRYLVMAVISELSVLTPSHIRFTHVKADLGVNSSSTKSKAAREPKKEPPKEGTKSVTIEGIIFGDLNTLETSLIGYVMKLEGSTPIFPG